MAFFTCTSLYPSGSTCPQNGMAYSVFDTVSLMQIKLILLSFPGLCKSGRNGNPSDISGFVAIVILDIELRIINRYISVGIAHGGRGCR